MPRIFSPVFSFKRNSSRHNTNEVRRSESHAARGHKKYKQSMTEQRKAVIKNADMSEDMQQEAVDCASQALSKYNIEKVSTERGRSCIALAEIEMQRAWSTPLVFGGGWKRRQDVVVLFWDIGRGQKGWWKVGVVPPPRFSNGLSNGSR